MDKIERATMERDRLILSTAAIVVLGIIGVGLLVAVVWILVTASTWFGLAKVAVGLLLAIVVARAISTLD